MKFRLKRGLHVQKSGGRETVHKEGDVVESPTDLVRRFGERRFEYLPAGPALKESTQWPRESPPDELEEATDEGKSKDEEE